MNHPVSKLRGRQRLAATLAGVALLGLVLWFGLRPGEPPAPDLKAIENVDTMKQAFYDWLLPITRDTNAGIRRDRERLLAIAGKLEAGKSPSWLERRWLDDLAIQYELDADALETEELLAVLKRRVDIVPPDLALAQAAKESGWGRSRFATEANNLFGQWCYEPGCGVVPARRAPGDQHEIERFDSAGESIYRYMNNINTHERYKTLRDLRASLRQRGLAISGDALAAGLVNYSERREAYVRDILAMMRQNRELLADGPDA